MAGRKNMWVVMQQGGSTTEWYAASFDTKAIAEDYRKDCADHTYQTSTPHKIKSCASHADWLDLIQNIVSECVEIA